MVNEKSYYTFNLIGIAPFLKELAEPTRQVFISAYNLDDAKVVCQQLLIQRHRLLTDKVNAIVARCGELGFGYNPNLAHQARLTLSKFQAELTDNFNIDSVKSVELPPIIVVSSSKVLL